MTEALPGSFDIKFAFNHWTLGEDFCVDVLGITEEQLSNHIFDMLRYLRFTSEQIQSANDYVCGTMTVEGAHYLKDQPLPVIDCTNRYGHIGTRYIAAFCSFNLMTVPQTF